MTSHGIGTRQEWRPARPGLLAAEKALARRRQTADLVTASSANAPSYLFRAGKA